jgi:hypothetical protein
MERGTQLIHEYLRHDKKFPHVWCPGCGNGILLGSLIRAIHHSGYEKDEVVLVSGIGCSGRLPVYVDFNTLHTTHGRALTFATGVKLANPKLQVIVIMGDGDATAIGGNHFIHAARRNLNLTAIIVNNNIYGMTGGQYSPTTPYGARAATALFGNIEHAFSIAELAVTAGASQGGRRAGVSGSSKSSATVPPSTAGRTGWEGRWKCSGGRKSLRCSLKRPRRCRKRNSRTRLRSGFWWTGIFPSTSASTERSGKRPKPGWKRQEREGKPS